MYQGDGEVPKESSMNQRSRKVNPYGKVWKVNLKGLRTLSHEKEKGARLYQDIKRSDYALKREETMIEVLKMLKCRQAIYK